MGDDNPIKRWTAKRKASVVMVRFVDEVLETWALHRQRFVP
nr:hypothetical protein BN993_03197 [Virgibacillus halodenitrificans]